MIKRKIRTKKHNKMKKEYSVKEYAELKQCSLNNIYKKIRIGTLQSKKVGSFIIVLV